MYHPTGRTPETVFLVGLGPTKGDFGSFLTPHEAAINPRDPFVEVWTVNTGIRFLQHDVAFVMDDLAWYADRYPQYGELLAASKKPIITSRVYDRFRTSIAYPLEEVVNLVGGQNLYFRLSQIPYIFAYALLIGVKRVVCFGIDYDYTNARQEKGRACAEYWVGFCRGRGMQITVCEKSTFLDEYDRNFSGPAWFYGYLYQPIVSFGEPVAETATKTPPPIPPQGGDKAPAKKQPGRAKKTA